MGNYGRGFSLAFFLFVSFFFTANVCFAEDYAEFPVIARLDWRDNNFKRYIADVESNRQRVFSRDKIRHESADAIASSLTV
jgi:hypothetical protein